jgi:ubiquitin carboxyl-terminal hydrolase 9/13
MADGPSDGMYDSSPTTLPRLDKAKLQAQAKTRSSEEGVGFSGRPKSAHASTTLGVASQPSPRSSTSDNVVKRASRKLSFSASFPFGRKDRQR